MKKVFGIIVSLVLLSYCSNNKNNGETTTMENNEKIEFTDSLGNKISKAELAKSTGTFNYEIYGIENVSQEAKSLHNKARQYGQAGDYEKAIETLKLAHKEAPNWAYPVYDLGYTYLLKDDYENALNYYKLTDSIAPKGFYTSKTAIHTLGKEKTGEFKQGLYKLYISLEWIDDSSKKLEMTKLLVSKFPTFAPGWDKYSAFLEGKDRIQAIEKGLNLDCDIETRGILLINKALAINQIGELKKAIEILTKVIFDTNSTYSNIEMAKFVLNNITEK